MSHYINQECDFINRTKKIIEQYEKNNLPKEDRFEVTLFLNCLVGLLILPQQHWFDNLPPTIISEDEWGINEDHISFIKPGETKNIKAIATHLRNSVAHYYFKAFDNSSQEISCIKFEDFKITRTKTGEIIVKKKTFEATIPIANIKQFTTKLTNTFIDEMTEQK